MSHIVNRNQPEQEEHKAEDNAWYLLATLHDGLEASDDDEVWSQNRVIWNRYVAAHLDDESRTRLAKRGVELSIKAPLDPDELASLQEHYATRHRATGSKAPATLPRLADGKIDLSGIEFERRLRWEGYLIPCELNMSGAKFKGATFDDAIFLGKASFDGATFSGGATFSKATFADDADFANTSYPGLADWADFEASVFYGYAQFWSTKFASIANFKGVAFSAGVSFSAAEFSNEAWFHAATFPGEEKSPAEFKDTKFSGTAYFS